MRNMEITNRRKLILLAPSEVTCFCNSLRFMGFCRQCERKTISVQEEVDNEEIVMNCNSGGKGVDSYINWTCMRKNQDELFN